MKKCSKCNQLHFTSDLFIGGDGLPTCKKCIKKEAEPISLFDQMLIFKPENYDNSINCSR